MACDSLPAVERLPRHADDRGYLVEGHACAGGIVEKADDLLRIRREAVVEIVAFGTQLERSVLNVTSGFDAVWYVLHTTNVSGLDNCVKSCYSLGMSMNVLQLADKLSTEGTAYLYLEELRWNGRPVCPHCGSVGQHYFLTPANGSSRKTRTGTASERRVWKCRDCRRQFSVITGTVMHGSKIPVRTWIFVIFEMVASKNGVAAREIERKYGLASKRAWHMMHRLREAMKRDPLAGLLSGIVIADETWYGGKPSNRHGHKRAKKGRLQGQTDKTPILALVSRQTGEVRSRTVPNVRAHNLREVLVSDVNVARTHLHTDSGLHYRKLAEPFAMHSTVDHSAGEYVSRGGTTTNHAETYFSQLKRSLDGTFHHVSREHVHRYLAEFDFRFSTCKQSDTERVGTLVGGVGGRRLTYREPICRVHQDAR